MKYHSFFILKLVLLKLIQNSIGCRKSAETQKTNFSRNKLDDNQNWLAVQRFSINLTKVYIKRTVSREKCSY